MDMIPQDNTPYKMCSNPACKNPWLPATTDCFQRDNHLTSKLTSKCKECINAKRKEERSQPEVRDRQNAHRRANYAVNPEAQARQHDYNHAYYYDPENHDQVLAQKKTYYQENREDILTQKRIYASDPGVRVQKCNYNHAYYEDDENRSHISKHQKSRYGLPEVQEQRRAYCQLPQTKAIYRTHSHNRRALEHHALGKHTPQQIKEQYARQKGKCHYCRNKVEWGKHHIDHVVPISRGGSNDISNLVIACPTCNQRKHRKLPHEWPEGGRLL